MGYARVKPKRLAEKLLQIRERFGLSQNGMLRRLGLSDELTRGNVSEFETGRREPSLPVLLKYARGSGVPMETLVDDELDLPTALPGRARQEQTARRNNRKE